MTDLEIFAEWHEKSLAKHIITKNAQAGAIIEFAKYYHKKQLSICDVVKRYRPKDGNDALRFLKENKEIEVANIVAFDMAKILEENTDYLFSFKKNLWNKGWAGFKIK